MSRTDILFQSLLSLLEGFLPFLVLIIGNLIIWNLSFSKLKLCMLSGFVFYLTFLSSWGGLPYFHLLSSLQIPGLSFVIWWIISRSFVLDFPFMHWIQSSISFLCVSSGHSFFELDRMHAKYAQALFFCCLAV